MAIRWKGDGHEIAVEGAKIADLRESDFAVVGDNATIEGAVKAQLESAISGAGKARAVLVHIFEKAPLHYALQIAPAGYSPPFADWWALPYA